MSEMLMEIGSSRPAVFCKNEILQISQKKSKMESIFRKTLSSQGCNCTKQDTIIGVYLGYIYVNMFFDFYFFVTEKTKAATGDVL